MDMVVIIIGQNSMTSKTIDNLIEAGNSKQIFQKAMHQEGDL